MALVTGGRVKIGYCVALRLLRAGARVIVTSRFPKDTALRFSKESDFKMWSDKINVYGIDFRHIPSVVAFTDFLLKKLDRLDILINNAAQTIRRPPVYYSHLLHVEAMNPFPEYAAMIIGQDFSMHHHSTIMIAPSTLELQPNPLAIQNHKCKENDEAQPRIALSADVKWKSLMQDPNISVSAGTRTVFLMLILFLF